MTRRHSSVPRASVSHTVGRAERPVDSEPHNHDPLAGLRYEPPPTIEHDLIESLRREQPELTQADALEALRSREPEDTSKLPARLRPKTTKHKGVTRIDHPAKRTFGYFVRVTWNKQRRSKFFSDSVYGDRLAALDAALQWRNDAERELGKPRTERQVIGVSRTSTGIVGVRRTVKDGREVYEATWRDGDRIRRTSYSIAKHGERRALSLARRAREKFERQRQLTPVGGD